MKSPANKYSLLTRFIIIVTGLFLLFFFYMTWKLENVQHRFIYSELLDSARIIERQISSMVKYTEDKMRFLGSVIVEGEEGQNPKNIEKFLKLFASDPKVKNILSWSAIGWISPENKAIIDSALGILKTPIEVKFREYIDESHAFPWKLNFGHVSSGYASRKLVIPAGMGVANKSGQIEGVLTIGFEISNLARVLGELPKNKSINYAILDPESLQIIIESPGYEISNNSNFIQNLRHLKFTQENEIYSNIAIFGIGESFLAYKLKKLPYLIYISSNSDIDSIAEALANLSSQFNELLLIFVVIVSLVALFYKSILDPLMRLSTTAYQLSKGNTKIDIPILHSSEASNLGEALRNVKEVLIRERKLLSQLSDAHKNLSFANEKLEEKVQERTKDLENALSAKTRFLNNVSHEVRTPVQGITALSRGLVDHWEELPEPKKNDLAVAIAQNSARLFSLVSNILDFSRIDVGNTIYNIQKVDLVILVEEMIRESMLYINNKNINIIFDHGNHKHIYTQIDKEKIEQVLRNLFINAIKFTLNGTIQIKISLGSQVSNDKIIKVVNFTIEDEGVGLAEDELDIIFEPFMQGRFTKANFGGTGLGLTICKEIIKGHNGMIWANNLNKGAAFHFYLPCGEISEVNKVEFDTSKIIEELKSNIIAECEIMNVLAIDDEYVCLSSLEMILYGTKYNLITANSGYDGLAYLQANPDKVHLVLLDLMMPDIDGLEVFKIMKKNVNMANIPVILQTGATDIPEINIALEEGVNGYIKKPYKKDQLLEIIYKVLAEKYGVLVS